MVENKELFINIQGWVLRPEVLPYWDNHNAFPNCEDHLYESPDGGAAVLIYSVIEVGMMNYPGFGAVFCNKTELALLLAIRSVNFAPFAQYSRDGSLVFLKQATAEGSIFCWFSICIKRPMLSSISPRPT